VRTANVVPALLLLLTSSSQGEDSQARVRFGSRVSEGSSSCQFGYTFREEGGRERTLVFVPPREKEAGSRSRTSTSPTSQPAGQE